MVNFKNMKGDTSSMDFMRELEEIIDRGMDTLGKEWSKPEIRSKYLIANTPFKDRNELLKWYSEIGYQLELQLAEERRGTPKEKYYIFTRNNKDAT